MARFLKDTDYKFLVDDDIRNTLANATQLLMAEEIAIEQIKNYLSHKYDLDDMLKKTDDDRNKTLIMLIIDMALFHLYSKLSPNQIPEIRTDRYKSAMDFLLKVNQGRLDVNFETLENSNFSLSGYSNKTYKF